MSVSFPVIYKSQNNSNIKKYYQNSTTGIVLENDILIKNMLQQNTSAVISTLDAQNYPNGSNVIVENTNFTQNLSINDTNCCLSNPTAFCIGSNFIQQPPADNQSYTITTGSNIFNTVENTVSAKIQLDVNNSPIFDTDLLVTITDGLRLFNSTNEQWTVLFDSNNKLLLQKAVNSGLNNQTGQSLLTIGEDIIFNNDYALGKNQNSYYTKEPTTNKMETNAISNAFLPTTNNINITVDLTKISSDGLGMYKIYQLESDISISQSASVNNISKHYVIGNSNDNDNNTNLSDVKSLDYYLKLFNDTSEDNNFMIKINNKNNDSGLNFTDSANKTYFTIDNSTMIDNLLFMENIVYPNKQISVEFTQNIMTITPNTTTTIAYAANNAYFSLTSNGESLNDTKYNTNGNIRLQIPAKTDRTTLINQTASVFPQITVDYDVISNELKINANVTYSVTNIVVPTGTNQYNSLTDNNGTSLYMGTMENSNVILSAEPNLNILDDEILLIKISPLTTLTNSEGNNILYILDDATNTPDVPIEAEISVQISGNIRELKLNNDLRLKVYPKTLTQLNLVGLGDANGDNKLTTVETNLQGLQPTNGWIIGYLDNVSTYATSALSVFTSLNTFPSLNDYINICNNNTSLTVNISYTINTYNYEQITISYGSNSFLVTGINLISNVNKINISTTYTNTGVTATYAGKQYHQIRVITILTYNAIFQLNLSGFNNINMTTPQIYSITTSYIYYPKVSNLQDTSVSISPDKIVISVNQTDGTQVSNLSFTYLDYKTTTAVFLNGLNNERTKTINTNITLTKASITPLNAQIQYRNKTGINNYSNWSNTGEIIPNIEPYFSTQPTITTTTNIITTKTYIITASIFPSQNTLMFNLPAYFTPLILDNLNTTNLASGYKYKISDLTGTMLTNFDPKIYIESDLIASNSALNLKTIINYTLPNAAEGNATYNATMTIINTDTQQTIATIIIENPDFSAPIILAKINKNMFKIVKTVNTTESTSYIWGDNTVNYSSGNIDLLDGVSLTYQNIKQSDFTNFSLKSDLIEVNMVGPNISTTPNQITSLTYTYPDCETMSIPYYRGYVTDEQTVTNTFDYVINRMNLTSYVINVTDISGIIFSSDVKTNIHTNSQYTISFNNGVNSIGATVTSLFSRLPASMLINNKKSMPITISSDSVTILRKTLAETTTTTHNLKDYKLYTFINGEVLKSLNLRSINLNEEYILAYSKANTFVFYNNSYIGNPADLTNWGTAISEVDFATARLGFNINQKGIDNTDNKFLNIGIGNNTRTNSITYFVIAEPQLVASQLDINGAASVPFDTTNPLIYDATKLITYYFPVNLQTNIYTPFVDNPNLNNMIFTAASIKNLTEYTDSSKNIPPTTFIITGSNIQIQETTSTTPATHTINGPAGDGIIFYGLISDLVAIPSTNPYYNYINLTSVTNTSQLNLTYTQENKNYFQKVFNTIMKPLNNIKFNINGYFIQDGTYKLVSSITKGIKTYIYDMIKQESSIILLKYECLNMDFTNIPKDTSIHQLNFISTKVFTTTVSMPSSQFGQKYLDRFNAITIENLQINSVTGGIIWTEINQNNFSNLTDISAALLNNFSLSITAINDDGLNDIIELLYATSDIPVNFTVINQSNAMEILGTDGTPKFVITPFGQILTSNINVNAITLFKTTNSNVDYIESNATVFNP
jgi:hypothetical protein